MEHGFSAKNQKLAGQCIAIYKRKSNLEADNGKSD
jgi:hypothetical protein